MYSHIELAMSIKNNKITLSVLSNTGTGFVVSCKNNFPEMNWTTRAFATGVLAHGG